MYDGGIPKYIGDSWDVLLDGHIYGVSAQTGPKRHVLYDALQIIGMDAEESPGFDRADVCAGAKDGGGKFGKCVDCHGYRGAIFRFGG